MSLSMLRPSDNENIDRRIMVIMEDNWILLYIERYPTLIVEVICINLAARSELQIGVKNKSALPLVPETTY